MPLCAAPPAREFILPVIRGGAPFSLLDPEIGWQWAILDQVCLMDWAKGQETAALLARSSFTVKKIAAWAQEYRMLLSKSASDEFDLLHYGTLVAVLSYLSKCAKLRTRAAPVRSGPYSRSIAIA